MRLPFASLRPAAPPVAKAKSKGDTQSPQAVQKAAPSEAQAEDTRSPMEKLLDKFK